MNQYSSAPGTVPDPSAGGLPACLASPLTEEQRLQDILRLAGPAEAAAVLGMILADLRKQQAALAAGLASGDAQVLRAASHSLIALAGTIGAPGLHHAAIDLNLMARQSAWSDLPQQMGSIGAGIAALCRDLTERRDGLTAGPAA